MPPKRPPIPRPTHFLCIPVTTPSSRAQLQSSLSIFKADVSASSTLPSSPPSKSTPPTHPQIPSSAIRPPSTLHLTLHILNLSTPSKLSTAIKILHSLFDEDDEHQSQNQSQNQNHSSNTNPAPQSKKSPRSLRTLLPLPPLTLHSLKSMHGPHSTSILYTSPLDPEKHLQTFCEAVRERFIDAGFVVPGTERGGKEREKERDLLLHATIVNTIYIPRGYEHEHEHAGPAPGRERKNARGIEIEVEGGSYSGTQTGNESKIKNTKEKTQKSHTLPKPPNRPPQPPKPLKPNKPTKPKPRLKFNAREILSRYANFTWMRDMRIEKVAICRMGAKKKGDEDGDEEYEVEAEVEVPWV
ncbi:ed94cd7d-ad7a-480c-a19f-f03853aa1944-CDS [Sclerotinia trifoliorum]|uniref:Ed94cd7d-ad7a-480c-a19f-f03853aa1944-CDS n=1 Tax=Sclerotinia trifoliorum TaxID=28548 RepID=A0A8H2VPF5_9HELO|nr:ed94cd7d-ad7a-480c-a19f-f03853aa1944-CDS [Sclerotinia trifoliorum]